MLLWLSPLLAQPSFVPLARAQGPAAGLSYPNPQYYASLGLYRDGRLADATESLEQALRRGRRDINGRWIDAIPTHAMLGECYYQLGDVGTAHKHFDAALQLMLQHDGWLRRVQWPQTVTQSGGTPALPNWVGGMGRAIRPGNVPSGMTVAVGQHDPTNLLRDGGVFQNAQLLTVDVAEILRCVGWTLYRRPDVLGPFAADDPLTEQVLGRLRAVPLAPGSWPTTWLQLLEGLAMIVDGQGPQAVGKLQQSMLLPGGLDHPLTPLATLALGRLMHESGNAATAADRLMVDALVNAIVQNQHEVAAEVFRVSTGHAAAVGGQGLYQQAIGFAASQARRDRLVGAAALLAAAELSAVQGRPADGLARLNDLSSILGRRGYSQPRVEAHGAYVRAVCTAQAGDLQTATSAVDAMLQFAKAGPQGTGSPRIYQTGLLQSAASSGSLGNKRRSELIDLLMGPPSALVWRRDPVDALASLSSNPSSFLQRQLEATYNQDRPEEVLGQVDRLLRYQFRSALPLGGRVVDARWLAAGPDEVLSGNAVELRKNAGPLLSRLIAAAGELDQLVAERAALPPRPEGNDVKQVDQIDTTLWSAADAAERAALTLALHRQPMPEVFPPPLEPAVVRATLPEDTALLAYGRTVNGMVGIWIHRDTADVWAVPNVGQVSNGVAQLLNQIGVGPQQGSAPRLPQDDQWQETARALVGSVAPPLNDARVDTVKRLMIVPTGPLWMLPFELLPVSGPEQRHVADRIQVSYAPTVGLAIQPPPPRSTAKTVGGLVNRFFHPRDGELDNAAAESLKTAVDSMLMLGGSNAIVGRKAKVLLQSMWIANANSPSPSNVFNFSPLYYDRSRPGGLLTDWMRFPIVAPHYVVLPGTNFIAADSLVQAGDTIFLSACALQAAGVPHVILARWNVAGESARQLLAELLAESLHADSRDAWQRSLLMLRATELSPDAEPLLTAGDAERWDLTGAEPLLWSSYISISGISQPAP